MRSGAPAGRVRVRASLPYQRSVLPNGLRVVTQPMSTARSVAVGLFVGVGSRSEDEAHAGLSHLLEHLVFKGTRRYPEPGGLSEAVEGSGGPGFIRGETVITLTDSGSGTKVSYTADLQVGGLIASVGQRMLGGVSKMMADKFFNRMSELLQA